MVSGWKEFEIIKSLKKFGVKRSATFALFFLTICLASPVETLDTDRHSTYNAA